MLIICPANLASPQTRKHNPKNKTEFPPEFEVRCSHGLQVRAARDHTGPRTRVLKTDIAMQPAVGTRGVYVLELETGGFYVGKSENVQARVQMRKHGFDNVRGLPRAGRRDAHPADADPGAGESGSVGAERDARADAQARLRQRALLRVDPVRAARGQ